MIYGKMRKLIISALGVAALGMGQAYASQSSSAAIYPLASQSANDNSLGSLHPLLPPAAISLFAPIGYGLNWGMVGAQIGGVDQWPGGSRADGNMAMVMGFGNGDETVGVTAAVLIDSIGINDPFAKNTGIAASAYRWLGPNTAMSVGVANVGGWGSFSDMAKTYYGSVTQLVDLFGPACSLPVALTLGAGTGGLNSPQDAQNNRDSNVRPFGSVGINVFRNTEYIIDYTAQKWSTGLSSTFIPSFMPPFNVTVLADNLGGANHLPGGVTYGMRVSMGYIFA